MDIQIYIQSGIIESYVLGLTSDDETAELLRLAEEHPDIAEAIRATEQAFEQNAQANAIAPQPAVKDHLLAALQQDFSAPSAATKDNTPVLPAPPAFKVPIWKALAAASIILLVISAAFNFYLYNQYQRSHGKYMSLLTERNSMQASMDVYKTRLQTADSSLSLITNPVMAQVSMPGVPGKENSLATVYWNTKTKDVYLLQNQLPAAPQGQQYQLWAIVDGQPVDAGVIDACAGLCKMKNIPSAQAFAITLEKEGGSKIPTLPNMFVMGKV